MFKFLGLDKLFFIKDVIKFNGGLRSSLYKLYRMDDLKIGKCVGKDKFGNAYYENNSYFFGRNRWVEYAPHTRMEYDGSQVCPEWFGWLHHKTDTLPHEDKARPNYKWMLEHTENLSGTKNQYVPYSTTRPKIETWIAPKRVKC